MCAAFRSMDLEVALYAWAMYGFENINIAPTLSRVVAAITMMSLPSTAQPFPR
jgi:hypothetical protein